MYSTCCIGADVEMSRMFDQYLFKGTESFDLSLSIPDPSQDSHNVYMSSDQTFHTPSFGDEEFDIPPISLPPSSMASDTQNTQQNYNPQGMSHSGMGEPVSVMTLGSVPQSMSHNPDSMNMGGNRMVNSPQNSMMGQQPHYTSPGMYLQPIAEGGNHHTSQADQMTSQSFETQTTYTTARPQMLMHPSPSQQGMMPAPGSTLLTTISQSQLTNQLGLQFGMPQRTPSVSGSSPGSNQTSPSQETSEDSDDSTPISQMMGALKRPSPEPVDTKVAVTKKPKVPKKKKKRDPNEPQKPVSAYALFFRDTQAAIKGQNPNASFGEVSKIVASMWDSLDAEHKNVYKKKTEAAKKEYLKALAAYRASLVSKQSSSEHTESLYGSGPSYGSNGSYSQQQQQQQQQTGLSSSISSSAVMLAPAAMTQAMPLQQHPQMQVPNPTMNTLTSPQQSSQMGQAVSTSSNYPTQSMMQQQQQQSNHPPPNPGGQQPLASPQGLSTNQPPNGRAGTCLRNGCQNPAVESPDWDSEYCRMYLPPGWLPGRHLILLPQ